MVCFLIDGSDSSVSIAGCVEESYVSWICRSSQSESCYFALAHLVATLCGMAEEVSSGNLFWRC